MAIIIRTQKNRDRVLRLIPGQPVTGEHLLMLKEDLSGAERYHHISITYIPANTSSTRVVLTIGINDTWIQLPYAANSRAKPKIILGDDIYQIEFSHP